jgi:hypothetical protein
MSTPCGMAPIRHAAVNLQIPPVPLFDKRGLEILDDKGCRRRLQQANGSMSIGTSSR